MEKYLVINADDFGASVGINRGIVESHAKGVVTSTSLMVYGRAVQEAVALSREHPGLESACTSTYGGKTSVSSILVTTRLFAGSIVGNSANSSV